MRFTEMRLAGAFLVELDERADERGFFARTFCQEEFADHGLHTIVAQANMSLNHVAGTLRGMHFQYPPVAETKLIRCVQGALYDVIVDLRPESPTYLEHVGVELSAENFRSLYVPERFAHGFMTLVDGTIATYQVGELYNPGHEGGLRFDDAGLGIDWPRTPTVVSSKDQSWSSLAEQSATLIARMAAADERSDTHAHR